MINKTNTEPITNMYCRVQRHVLFSQETLKNTEPASFHKFSLYYYFKVFLIL